MTHDPFEWVAESVGKRAILKKTQPNLFNEVNDLFFEFDPIGINYDTNLDEYEPEVGTILPRLPG